MPALRDLPARLLLLLLSPQARTLWRCLLPTLMLLVCLVAFDPTPRPMAVGHLDKVQHVLAFVPLSFAARWVQGADSGRALAWRPLAWAGLAMLAFGVFIEVGQAFIPGRSASPADVLADALGIVLGLLLAVATGRVVRFAAAPARLDAAAEPER